MASAWIAVVRRPDNWFFTAVSFYPMLLVSMKIRDLVVICSLVVAWILVATIGNRLCGHGPMLLTDSPDGLNAFVVQSIGQGLEANDGRIYLKEGEEWSEETCLDMITTSWLRYASLPVIVAIVVLFSIGLGVLMNGERRIDNHDHEG